MILLGDRIAYKITEKPSQKSSLILEPEKICECVYSNTPYIYPGDCLLLDFHPKVECEFESQKLYVCDSKHVLAILGKNE